MLDTADGHAIKLIILRYILEQFFLQKWKLCYVSLCTDVSSEGEGMSVHRLCYVYEHV